MEKLTLEHLATYLPYRLRVYTDGKYNYKTFEMIQLGSESNCIWARIDKYNSGWISNFKPILRPLSDIDKAKIVESYGEMVTFENYIKGDFDLGNLDWVLKEVANGNQVERLFDLPYCAFKEFYKYHFDVFGLHEKGLCIYYNEL